MNFHKLPSEVLVQRLRMLLEREREKERAQERLLHDLHVHTAEREAAWAEDRAMRQQLQQIDRAMATVSRALAGLAGSASLPAVVQVIVDQARLVVDCDYAAFGSTGNVPERPCVSWVTSGLEHEVAASIGRLPAAVGVLGAAILGGRTTRVADVRQHPAYRGYPEHHPLMTSFLGVPVRYGDQVLGNLLLANRRGATEFSDEDQRSAEMLAERVGVALEIARLHDLTHDALLSRDNLLAVVSHDLRTPLSVISNTATLLLRSPPDAGEAHRQLEIIKRAAELVSGLVEDLLQAATIGAGHFTTEPRVEDPAQLVDECMQLLGQTLAKRSLRFERQVAPALPLVRCDRRRVLQVFSNLVANAVKFTPAGGLIRVLAEPEKGAVRFSVSDTGCGIPKDQLPQLFDRYWRGQSKSWEGAGLGLFIAKTIVESHGGRLWVESEPGVGSTFAFTLPLAPSREAGASAPGADAPAPVAQDAGDPGARLEGLRVLLVDDEANALSALGLLLGDAGLVVSEATSGEQALVEAAARRPDVVVLDVEMPGMSGLVLLQRLRERFPGLPAVIMSGYMQQHAGIEEAQASTGAAYIAKPVDVDELLRMLVQLFAGPRPWRPGLRPSAAR